MTAETRDAWARRPLIGGTRGAVLSARFKAIPWIFYPLARLRETHKKRLVRRTTDIVIEGASRSGNHFATYAFQFAQERPIDIAHHFHSPAQLVLAARWGVPAILLIRPPADQVASAILYRRFATPGPALQRYIAFNRAVLPVAKAIVVAPFEEVISDFGAVIRRVNERYQTHFAEFAHSEENVAQVFEVIEREHTRYLAGRPERDPRPNEAKTARKEAVMAMLAHAKYAGHLRYAESLYETITAH